MIAKSETFKLMNKEINLILKSEYEYIHKINNKNKFFILKIEIFQLNIFLIF